MVRISSILSKSLNGSPHVYALLPHAASLFLRGRGEQGETKGRAAEAVGKGTGKGRRRSGSEWDPRRGRLYFETPFTQGVAGWFRGETASFPQVELATDNPFAVLVATSLTNEPIASTKRLLVSAIARVQPTDFRWVNGWKRRGRQSRTPAVSPGAGHRDCHVEAQRRCAVLRAEQ